MKFRDPKTGKVFEDIQNARISFCIGEICSEDCPFGCAATMERNPAEAARLMGLDVITDKEEPMEKTDKPRICEVLGVEVGEPFKVDGYNGEYHINDDGVLKWGGQTSDDAIYEAINHPERIIKRPFSEFEVIAARALINAGAHIVYRNNCGTLRWACNEFDNNSTGNVLPDKLFPSVCIGQSVNLEEIIDGKL